ncbi:sigma factor-like helix-turn-helix DNA-binding protein [Thermosulfurimonas sp. F29]|uniref:sigma factor-like helix-turn-helix DNA-binding protein n=1 Tax=Thermosulfurimonas sp. F29 TaxID=2867247 RepID=UPI001C83444C|nr:sigma factor-like helix-turn-helix DNA-binding protein [Thermosulfurimonas sp. F29]MBX6423331.1 hypothetical protein [Thermosulfurimonas sp. F29]
MDMVLKFARADARSLVERFPALAPYQEDLEQELALFLWRYVSEKNLPVSRKVRTFAGAHVLSKYLPRTCRTSYLEDLFHPADDDTDGAALDRLDSLAVATQVDECCLLQHQAEKLLNTFERTVLRLRMEGFSYKAIAQKLQISHETARQLTKRSMSILRRGRRPTVRGKKVSRTGVLKRNRFRSSPWFPIVSSVVPPDLIRRQYGLIKDKVYIRIPVDVPELKRRLPAPMRKRLCKHNYEHYTVGLILSAAWTAKIPVEIEYEGKKLIVTPYKAKPKRCF